MTTPLPSTGDHDRTEVEEKYRNLFRLSNDAIFVLDAETGAIVETNRRAESLAGYEAAELREMTYEELHTADEVEPGREAFQEVLETGSTRFRSVFQQRDGGRVPVEISASRLELPGRTVVQAVVRNMSEQVEAEKALRRSEERYRRLFEDSKDAIYLTDAEGYILHANPAAVDLFGLDEDRLDDLRLHDLVVEEDELERLEAELERKGSVQDFELSLRASDGSRLECQLTSSARTSPDGELEGYQGIVRNITDRKKFEEQLERRALHDQLTGLPNRALFWDRLSHAIARSHRSEDQTVAVCFIDLDRFKIVNDSLGHSAGDRVLERVGHRIRNSFRAEDTVARFGGDEFTVLLEAVSGPDDPAEAARRLLQALESPFQVEGENLRVTASVGIALASDVEDPRPDDLVRNADVAMYRAKDKGGTAYHVFDPEVDQTDTHRLEQENRLREAVERREFVLRYQPIVSLADGTVGGVEPLARWEHPDEGLLAPSDFITLAEDSGLIVPLGEYLLGVACGQLMAWNAEQELEESLSLQVNLSARQFEDPGLIKHVQAVLEATGLEPERLQFEVTERVVMQGTERIAELKGLGVRLAVDDFGTGYSSLSYLKKLQVDALKIDRSFVAGLGRDPRDEAIVRTIITLGRTLELEVVAEGIEGERELGVLKEMGCEWGQGYHFSRPLPPEEFRDSFLG